MEEKINTQPIYLNYNRKSKWLGIIDYKSLSFIIVYVALVIYFLSIISIKVEYLIYIFMFLVIPVISIVFINIQDESVIDMLKIMILFVKKRKIYINEKYVKDLSKELYIKYDKTK